MSLIQRLIKLVLDLGEVIRLRQRKGLLHFFGESTLIAFECQDI